MPPSAFSPQPFLASRPPLRHRRGGSPFLAAALADHTSPRGLEGGLCLLVSGPGTAPCPEPGLFLSVFFNPLHSVTLAHCVVRAEKSPEGSLRWTHWPQASGSCVCLWIRCVEMAESRLPWLFTGGHGSLVVCHGWSFIVDLFLKRGLAALPAFSWSGMRERPGGDRHLLNVCCMAAGVPGTFLRECCEGAGALPIFQGSLGVLGTLRTFQKLTWDLNPGSPHSKPKVFPPLLSVWPRLSCCPREKIGRWPRFQPDPPHCP